MGFDGEEFQAMRALRVCLPGRPGRQEGQSQAEAGFQYGPAFLALPGLWQTAPTQEDMFRLGPGTAGGVVSVTIALAEGYGFGLPIDRLGHETDLGLVCIHVVYFMNFCDLSACCRCSGMRSGRDGRLAGR